MTDAAAPRPDEAWLAELRRCPTTAISDCLRQLPGATGLRPFCSGERMVGPAFTVRTAVGDNLYVHEALDHIIPGDVLVIDGEGDLSRALIGEIIVSIAKARGAAGLVVFGAIRDTVAIAGLGLPCFAAGVHTRGPSKNGPGAIGVTVLVGGMTVRPGDLVVADEDGVVAFPPELAPAVIRDVAALEAKEREILRAIAEGSYTNAYGRQ